MLFRFKDDTRKFNKQKAKVIEIYTQATTCSVPPLERSTACTLYKRHPMYNLYSVHAILHDTHIVVMRIEINYHICNQ
jgi:hypothetical protein